MKLKIVYLLILKKITLPYIIIHVAGIATHSGLDGWEIESK